MKDTNIKVSETCLQKGKITTLRYNKTPLYNKYKNQRLELSNN